MRHREESFRGGNWQATLLIERELLIVNPVRSLASHRAIRMNARRCHKDALFRFD